MKIIYHGYNTCCQNSTGGVQLRLRKIASLVEKRGVEVELFNPFETKIKRGDILHIFMATPENFNLIQYMKRRGVKVVISTIVNLCDAKKLWLYKSIRKLPVFTPYKMVRLDLQVADFLITESQKESAFLKKYYGIDLNNTQIIPNGVDVDDYDGPDIWEKLGKQCTYVLQVGRFDANKNQLNVIKALKNTDVDVVFIGGPGNETYYTKCREEAKEASNIHFLGWCESGSALLRSAYAHADSVILPSFDETFGLTAIEGGMKGAKILFSNTLPIVDYPVFSECRKFSPNSIAEIRKTVEESIREEKNPSLRQNVIRTFNWDSIIDSHLAIYNRI